jgi:hypothetical protein
MNILKSFRSRLVHIAILDCLVFYLNTKSSLGRSMGAHYRNITVRCQLWS